MDALYLLIPLSVVLILAIGALLVWAALSGQFESLDEEGRRILDEDGAPSLKHDMEPHDIPASRDR